MVLSCKPYRTDRRADVPLYENIHPVS